MLGEDLIDDLVVEPLADDDAGRGQAAIEQALLQGGGEDAEDVARTEVDPRGVLCALFDHRDAVEGGEGVGRTLPQFSLL